MDVTVTAEISHWIKCPRSVHTVQYFVLACRFLVEARWHSQLKTFLGMDCNNEARQSAMVGDTDDHKAVGNSDAEDALASAHPGPVDNGPLFNTDISGEIREHLVEGLDYVLVPDDAWKLLETHFGLTRGQKPIGRKAS